MASTDNKVLFVLPPVGGVVTVESTTTVQVPVKAPSSVRTVIIAVPGARGVTTASLLATTVATAGLLEDQNTLWLVALSGLTLARRVTGSPKDKSSTDSKLIDTSRTGTGLGVDAKTVAVCPRQRSTAKTKITSG